MDQNTKNSTLYKNYNLVWYGVCETECEPLNLDEYADKIDFVFQTSNDVGGWNCWASSLTKVSGINDFNKLLCGNQYIIKLKSDSEPVVLPNTYVSNFAYSEKNHTTEKRLVDNCNFKFSTPTPSITEFLDQTPTPTIYNTPTPDVCLKVVFDATGYDQQFVIPDGVYKLTAEVWGAGGSDGCFTK